MSGGFRDGLRLIGGLRKIPVLIVQASNYFKLLITAHSIPETPFIQKLTLFQYRARYYLQGY